jgi:UDP-N-acetyl-2-amino-2-deoxyglucuronate dehydrogenase
VPSALTHPQARSYKKINYFAHMKQLNFGIIGCGRIARRHAEHIASNGKLVAVCDIEKTKADELAHEYEAVPYQDINAMFAGHPEMDVVAICTPNGLHAIHTIAALNNGFHVLCEKPMAINVADCKNMIDAAEKAGRRLFMVMQNRFNPPVMAVKKLVDEDRLGKIFSIQLNCIWNRKANYYEHSWKGTKALDGGTLYTQFSHFIDLLFWIFGDIKEVTGFIGNYHHKGIIEFEDTGVVTVKFENGYIGTINYSVNSFEKNMEGSLTVIAEKGTVKIGGQYLNELEYQHIDGYEIKDLPQGNPANHYGEYVGSMSNHDKVYANVVAVLNGNATIATTGFEGLKTVEIIEKIYSAVTMVQ